MSDSPDPYEQLASLYDQVMAGFIEDIDLYRSLARARGGPVLELGAGTGRVAGALSDAGVSVIALDRSRAMLRLAAAPDGRKGPRLVQGDMRRPPIRGTFPLIVCARDTFLHLENRPAQSRCLAEAAALLSPAGTLVLDLPGPGSDLADWEPGARAPVLDWTRVLDGHRISRYVGFTADLAEQAHDVVEIHETIDPDGAVRRRVIEYRLRFCFPEELLLLLEAAGLRVTDRYGGYELEPFDAGSERMIVLASRASV